MQRIHLSENSKRILLELQSRNYQLLYHKDDYYDIHSLISLGLISATELPAYNFAHVKLTLKGRMYLHENPQLKNPCIWDDKQYLINTVISLLALVVAIIALFRN